MNYYSYFKEKYLGIFLATTITGVLIYISRIKILRERRKELRRRKAAGNVNIGAIFGMDIGGSLTKIVYFEPSNSRTKENISVKSKDSVSIDVDVPVLKKTPSFAHLAAPEHKAALQELYNYMDTDKTAKSNAIHDTDLSFESSLLGGKINFLHFETKNMMEAINYLSSTAITENIRTIGCTGGGSHKYAQQFAEQLEIKVLPLDELECLVKGLDFVLTNVHGECYTYRNNASYQMKDNKNNNQWQKDIKESMTAVTLSRKSFLSPKKFPYLVVNIGSGVSILKIISPGQYERVSGTSLGGGTYWGLCRLLTSCSSFKKVLDLAETGDASEIDMLVRDIYGGDYTGMNLNGSMVASSFGKLVMKEEPRKGLKEEDLAIALLMMITNNIGQVAYLNAQLHECTKIFFVGNFLRHNSISCRRLAFAINFWSKGKMEAIFLKHEGYFGALGTFLQSAFDESDLNIILENIYENNNNSNNNIKSSISVSPDDDGDTTSSSVSNDLSITQSIYQNENKSTTNKKNMKLNTKIRSFSDDNIYSPTTKAAVERSNLQISKSWQELQEQPFMKISQSNDNLAMSI